jgi:hypothetical protein
MDDESNIDGTKLQRRARTTFEAVVDTITATVHAHSSSSSAESWRVDWIWPNRRLRGKSLGIVILNTAALIAWAVAAAHTSSTAP